MLDMLGIVGTQTFDISGFDTGLGLAESWAGSASKTFEFCQMAIGELRFMRLIHGIHSRAYLQVVV